MTVQAQSLTTREAVNGFRERLERDGMRSALRFVNGLTTHRFTALFRFEGGTLRNLVLVDRDDPSVEVTAEQSITDSYCIFVRQTAERFITEASLDDDRVAGHPKQLTVQSYCGVPLMSEDGTLYGTICHFDYAPLPFEENEVILLEHLAPIVVRALTAARDGG